VSRNLADTVKFTNNTRKAYLGKCIVVVKMSGNRGIVRITAVSGMLKKGEAKLEIQ